MQLTLLIAAAFIYSLGGYYMKLSAGLSNAGATATVLILFCLGAVLHIVAMRHSEMSTTYIIVIGLEAITVVLLGMFLLGEGVTLVKVAGILSIVVGVALLQQ